MSEKTRRIVLGVGLLLGLGLAAGFGFFRWAGYRGEPPVQTSSAYPDARVPEAGDPRVTFATPYRNVRPEVRYVGDTRCTACHAGQAETYQHHPMGRTLALVSRAGGTERYDQAAHNPFQALGFEFSVLRRGEKVVHRVVRRDRQGRVVTKREEEALLALGSGRHGHAYILNHDGYLFHSAIGWYRHRSAWDVAPEFKETYPRLSPITVRCMFCHSNEVRWVEDSLNHFENPQLHSSAIGCERCHGPGELHVAARTRAEEVAGPFDDTIVNPRHLPPALREAVCQQCHLRGQAWVLRRG